jgi:hypothetical protein
VHNRHQDPLNQWDQLLEQSEMSLNMLRMSRLNPKLSAYAQVNGEFDYNTTPMAPPSIKVLIHEKPSACAMHAANNLITALEKPHPATPFNIGNEQVRAL